MFELIQLNAPMTIAVGVVSDVMRNFSLRALIRRLLIVFRHTAARLTIAFRTASQTRAHVCFVVGCGRSGTSLMGDLLALHPSVYYVREPYHVWAAIDPRMDVNNLFYTGIKDEKLIMREIDLNESIRARFARAFSSLSAHCGAGGWIVEKTPQNALRIDLLNSLAPECKFVEIVRDGLDVSLSIARLAKINEYRIAYLATFNQWWGVKKSKLKTLKSDVMQHTTFGEEVQVLRDDAQWGALEWVLSLQEVERARGKLGSRLLVIRYPDVIERPDVVLGEIQRFLSLERDDVWRASSIRVINETAIAYGSAELRLPHMMCETFNAYQQKYGFVGRARPI